MPLEVTPILNQLRQRAASGGEVGNEGFGEEKQIEITGLNEKSFADMVQEAVNSVDQAQKTASQNVENIVSGKSDNIHEAMISMEKAQLSFQMMLEIRNKAVETYKELSRMQI